MSRIVAAVATLACLLMVSVGPLRVRAQGPDGAERTAAARALFEQGMRAVDERDWATAADRLRRSLEVRSSPVVAYNLALALTELGQLVEASEHLRTVQRESPEGSDAHRLASERLAEVLPRLGRLRIEVTGARSSVEVRLDGAAVPEAVLDVPQPADPGAHRVTLHRGADEIGASEVTVVSGQLATVSLEAPPSLTVPADDAVATAEPAAGGGVEREWWFWTLIGGVVVGAAVAIALAFVLTPEPLPYIYGDSQIAHPTLLERP